MCVCVCKSGEFHYLPRAFKRFVYTHTHTFNVMIAVYFLTKKTTTLYSIQFNIFMSIKSDKIKIKFDGWICRSVCVCAFVIWSKIMAVGKTQVHFIFKRMKTTHTHTISAIFDWYMNLIPVIKSTLKQLCVSN